MWITIIACTAMIVVVFIGVRNSIVSGRASERIKNTGKETTARITHAEQHKNQSVEGVLVLHLKVEFDADNKKIVTGRDIIVKIFNVDEYKAGNQVTVRYSENDPTKFVVMGDGVRN